MSETRHSSTDDLVHRLRSIRKCLDLASKGDKPDIIPYPIEPIKRVWCLFPGFLSTLNYLVPLDVENMGKWTVFLSQTTNGLGRRME